MQRYFAQLNDQKIILSDEDIHHISHVMRMKIGDKIEVVINGIVYNASIISFSSFDIKINHPLSTNSEIPYDVTLFYALAKGDKIDLVVQKATELGVKRIVLLSTERCVVKWDEKEINRKLERFQKIAKEASEQSHRSVIPEIIGVYTIKEIKPELLCDLNLFAYEKEAGNTTNLFDALLDCHKSVSFLVGPEGGFSPSEAEYIGNILKFKPVSLGKRILRSETAAIYALSVAGFMLEK